MSGNEVYGAGKQSWGKVNNRYNSSNSNSPSSYQTSYQPPKLHDPKASYAQQQTHVTEDSLRTQYQAEGTANTVLTQMTTQRYQLQNAQENVADTRLTTEAAKKELQIMTSRIGRRKKKLQAIIALLAILNIFCFFRLLYCGGSFFCR